jgi:hypothetical protein
MSEQEYYECSVCCHSTTSETKAAEHASTHVAAATAEVNKVINRMTELVITPVIEKTVVDASKGGYEVHPESYSPLRLIVFVQSTGEHYELLKTGEAITWGTTPPPASLEHWEIDIPHISWVGVKRAN